MPVLSGLFVVEHSDGSVVVEGLNGVDGKRESLSSMSFQMQCSALAGGVILRPHWVELTDEDLGWNSADETKAMTEKGYHDSLFLLLLA